MSEDQQDGTEDGLRADEGAPAEGAAETEHIQIQSLLQNQLPPLSPLPPQPPASAGAPAEAPDRVPADRRRAAVVAVFNLSGLGLGYAFMRRWVAAAVCWVATGILLLVALPVTPSGVSGGLLVVYLIVLAIAAVHGAYRGLRTPLTWPQRPEVAAALAAVLLVVPIGGSVLYNQAHDNAVQQQLLGQLHQADSLVAGTEGDAFTSAEPQYNAAMAIYRTLLDDDRSSQAGQLVPGRLAAFYQTVAVLYKQQDFCDSIEPLTYLYGLSGEVAGGGLAAQAGWPDGPLATSLYHCGLDSLDSGGSTATTDLSKLLTTFPTSSQAGQVAPAIAATINKTAAGISGSNPCSATSALHTLGTQASALTGGTADVTAALQKDTDTADADVEAGTFACGVSQYKSGDFTDAQTTMDNLTSTYQNDPNATLAQNFSIAAQIAQDEPAAGKVLPTAATGGSVSVTILNDSPDPLRILYTGPDTGTVNLAACGSCSTYPNAQAGQQDACGNSSTKYPQTTIDVQPGTTYFLQQDTSSLNSTPNASSEQYEAGNAYSDCAYETSFLGSLL